MTAFVYNVFNRHPSHWGRVCFLSTPDGENCGLVKNLSLLGLVSTQIMEPVVEELFDSGMEELVDDTSTPLSEKHKVLLNGDWVGVCSDSDYFVAELKSRRRQSELPRQVSSVLTDACVILISCIYLGSYYTS